MRRLNYYVACSVDGFIENREGGTSAFSGRDTHPFDFVATLAAYDVLLMGRKTYDYSRSLGHETDPNKENYVFSRTMTHSPDPNVTIVAENMVEFVRSLKQKAGKVIWLVGGADLASQLLAIW
jgi:dihydrofolate reductase